MVFIPPTWSEGLIIQIGIFLIIPLIIGLIIGIIIKIKTKEVELGIIGVIITTIVLIGVMMPVGSIYWHDAYEVPSVQEKIITVQEWQPKAGIETDSNGNMVISNADQLMLITTDNEGFLNEENFLFNKFDTRDVFNKLKVNGTYKIKYFGWRNAFNSGFPTILSVEEVINETNATNNEYNKYFGNKLAIQ
ncbi:hypothetical protein SDC9_07465 [bioreactor metagenome]|uniref:Uncharacterized protein n=1 Tax=bioreactor metagenome TaxID=1076179 RepID=A0A644T4M2_9ZZZZ|nr:hypothetical protein [Methanobrevibacter sp.]MEA4956920.1 hypothetical protein [Methanobrevibacter sp.]